MKMAPSTVGGCKLSFLRVVSIRHKSCKRCGRLIKSADLQIVCKAGPKQLYRPRSTEAKALDRDFALMSCAVEKIKG